MGSPPFTGITYILYTARENNIFPPNLVTIYPEIYISLETAPTLDKQDQQMVQEWFRDL